MTITYTAQVATCRHLGCFWKLLFRWKGSIYKLLWLNMLFYILLYSALKYSSLYLFDDDQNEVLKEIAHYCHTYYEGIPLSFLLGFYVAVVLARWWEQYQSIPWPDNLAVLVSVLITGQDVRGRVMRRTIMRYANLTLVMTFLMISPFVRRRFPNYQSFVDAGLLLPSEHQRFKELEKRTVHPKHWVPLVWAIAIVARARREGKVVDDISKDTLIGQINEFRGSCGALLNYDWISIPLVYPQVVSWAVYTYFLTTIVSYQYPLHERILKTTSLYMSIPIFPMLQFFFYMGWLLVAETLANPFGEDDDDFDISWLIDRNIQVSYFIADEMHNYHPDLIKDHYWDDVLPPDVSWNPHTDVFDDSDDVSNAQKDTSTPGYENKKGKWVDGSEIPMTFAKADFISRSLDFGSERVIRVYLPPSLSKITFGSVMSKGSRPSGDSKPDQILPIRDIKADSGNQNEQLETRIEIAHQDESAFRTEEQLVTAAMTSNNAEKEMEDNLEEMYSMLSLMEEAESFRANNLSSDLNSKVTITSHKNELKKYDEIDKISMNKVENLNLPTYNSSFSELQPSYPQINNQSNNSSKVEKEIILNHDLKSEINEKIISEEVTKFFMNEKILYRSFSCHSRILNDMREQMNDYTFETLSHDEMVLYRSISLPADLGKVNLKENNSIITNRENEKTRFYEDEKFNYAYENEDNIKNITETDTPEALGLRNEDQLSQYCSVYEFEPSDLNAFNQDLLREESRIYSDALSDQIFRKESTLERITRVAPESSESTYDQQQDEPRVDENTISDLKDSDIAEIIEEMFNSVNKILTDENRKSISENQNNSVEMNAAGWNENEILKENVITGIVSSKMPLMSNDNEIFNEIPNVNDNENSTESQRNILNETVPTENINNGLLLDKTSFRKRKMVDNISKINNNEKFPRFSQGVSPNNEYDRINDSSSLDPGSISLENYFDEDSGEFRSRVQQSLPFKCGTMTQSQLKLELKKMRLALPTIIEIPDEESTSD